MFTDDLPLFDEPCPLATERPDFGDEDGPLDPAVADFLGLHPYAPPPLTGRRCTRRTLDGSWFLHLEPAWPHLATAIRGPLRIETGGALRASADLYVRRGTSVIEPRLAPITALPFIVGGNWYPHLPQAEYAFYLRSTGMAFAGDRLTIPVVRHIWDRAAGRFGVSDAGYITLGCAQELSHYPRLPQPTVRLTGAARIGGRNYRVTATKTAPYHRGFSLEVDLVRRREGRADRAPEIPAAVRSAFHRAGLDARVSVDQVDAPASAGITSGGRPGLPSIPRPALTADSSWQMWLLVGAGPGAEPVDRRLGEAPLGFLRRLRAGAEIDLPVDRDPAAPVDPEQRWLTHAPDPLIAPGWAADRLGATHRPAPQAPDDSAPAVTRLSRPTRSAQASARVEAGSAGQ